MGVIYTLKNGALEKFLGNITLDSQLNNNSNNGVKNKVITQEINGIKSDLSSLKAEPKTRYVHEANLISTTAGQTQAIDESTLKGLAGLGANDTIVSAIVTNLGGSTSADIAGSASVFNFSNKTLCFTPTVTQTGAYISINITYTSS